MLFVPQWFWWSLWCLWSAHDIRKFETPPRSFECGLDFPNSGCPMVCLCSRGQSKPASPAHMLCSSFFGERAHFDLEFKLGRGSGRDEKMSWGKAWPMTGEHAENSYRLTQADGSVQLRRISWTGSPDKLLKNNFMDLEDALFRLYVARALCWENNIVLFASCARKRKGFTILFNEHKEIHQKIWCKFNQVVFSNYYHFYHTQTWSVVYN